MYKKTLTEKTVKQLRELCSKNSITVKPNSLKDDIIDELVRFDQKQKRLAKKMEKQNNLTPPKSDSTPTVTFAKPLIKNLSTKTTANVEPCTIPKLVKSTKSSKSSTPITKSNGKSIVSEELKKSADGKYTIIKQLGSPGKEGTTFLVRNRKGDEYAMKIFSKQKSVNTLLREAEHQKQVAKHGLAPEIKDINQEHKYIVMEKLDKNLFDVVKKNNGEIPETLQKKIVNIIKKLDNTGVFHGDPNPANFMTKGSTMYIIDFGFAKPIDDKLVKKYETNSPNIKFMILGLMLKLKEIYRDHNPDIEYKIFTKTLEKK